MVRLEARADARASSHATCEKLRAHPKNMELVDDSRQLAVFPETVYLSKSINYASSLYRHGVSAKNDSASYSDQSLRNAPFSTACCFNVCLVEA